jgi:hypothetical protein
LDSPPNDPAVNIRPRIYTDSYSLSSQNVQPGSG